MKGLFPIILFLSFITVLFIFLPFGCDSSSEDSDVADEPRACTVNADCYSTENCVDEVCKACRCLELGGICEDLVNPCPAGTFDWASLECPQGRDGKCCMPAGSCSGAFGSCIHWQADCPEGTGAYGSMDCPEGRYEQCCIPVR